MPKPIPTSNRKWFRESEKAYRKAKLRAEKGIVPIEDVYLLAAELAGNRRGETLDAIEEASLEIRTSIAEQRSRENPGEFIFEFYACYLDAHVHFGYLKDMEVDEIMDYICSQGGIFLRDFEDDWGDV